MLTTRILRQAQASSVAASVLKLLPKTLLPALAGPQYGNLYQILSRLPRVKGLPVHQKRWSEHGVQESYWTITHVEFKCEGKHGKVWGIRHWKGKKQSEKPERIRGALKYSWALGRSRS